MKFSSQSNHIPALLMCGLLLLIAQSAKADTLISGTYRNGSNITEPKPQKSKYLKTTIGGVGVTDTGVKYVVYVDIYRPFKRAMYMKVEFENPAGEPFIEESEIPPGQRGLQLVHGPVKGLQVHHSYQVKVYLYEFNDRTKPIDILTQDIKSYADTTGEEIIYKTSREPQNALKKRARRKK